MHRKRELAEVAERKMMARVKRTRAKELDVLWLM